METTVEDPLLCVVPLAWTTEPQKLVWLAAHQDYSSEPAFESAKALHLTEAYFGQRVVEMLLKGDRGHFGCFEHPQISFNCCYVPHSTMVQARTHRVGVTFDVQSFRYTSSSILSIETNEDLEKAFYIRPLGQYTDRQGNRYEYSERMRAKDISRAFTAAQDYKIKVTNGMSEEHARGGLPEVRQHMVVSFNARSLMHFLDLRSKADSQLEIQWLSHLLFSRFAIWMPQVAQWYEERRLHKAKLAP